MKKRTSVLVWALAVLLLAACTQSCMNADVSGQESETNKHKPRRSQKSDSADSGDSRISGEEETSEEDGTETLNLEDWKQAYLAYLAAYEQSDSCTYSLIYVDDDDIPELVIDTGSEAGGCQILTWHDGVGDCLQTMRLYFTYLEKGNLLCNSDGHMGFYYDEVYTIEDGKWVYVAGGAYGDGAGGPQFDENGEFIYEYHWMDQDVEKSEYEAKLEEVYPEKQGRVPGAYYIRNELVSILKTGETTSANHRYELIVEDVTWEEARRACASKGGYLAAITSQEEFERIQAQILAEEKTAVTFFVGAEYRDVQGFCWLEPGTENGYPMLQLFNALFAGFWMEGEPSYTGTAEDGTEIREEGVSVLYRSSDRRCWLNDVPKDILSAYPSYAGKIGYICEYDD